MSKPPSLAARCLAAGIKYSTARARRAAGWSEADLLTPPLPVNHGVNKRRPTQVTHPWRQSPGAGTKKAGLSALNLRKRAKREHVNG